MSGAENGSRLVTHRSKDLMPVRLEIVITTRREAKVLHRANVHGHFKDLELQLGRIKLLCVRIRYTSAGAQARVDRGK